MHTYRRALGAALAASVGLAPLSIALAPAAEAADPAGALGSVVINEVSSSGFAGGDFIELHNTSSSAPVDLTGYHLTDGKGIASDPADTDFSDIVLDGMIAPQGHAVILTEGPAAVPADFGLGSGDSATLLSPDGATVIDTHTWTTHQAPSVARTPDGTGAFTTTSAPTPGGPNALTTTAAAQVTINEVLTDGAGTSAAGVHDYVELHNGGTVPIDLTGWYLTDGAGTPTAADRVTLGGPSAVVPAGGYLAVETELLDSEIPAGFTYLPASNGTKSGFGLNKLDWAFLFTPDDTLAATTFKGAVPDAHADTWSRLQPGTGLWRNGALRTPGAVNAFPGGGTEDPSLDPNWDDVEINEISSLNDDDAGNPGLGDAVELVNTGTAAVSIEGWHQTDSGAASGAGALALADLRVWEGDSLQPATSWSIPAGGRVVFSSRKGLSGEGDAVKVYGPGSDPAARQLVDEQAYGDGDGGASDNYESDSLAFAACPDGSDEFWRVTTSSFGQDNTEACATKSRRLDTPVVLNEVSNLDGKAELLNTGAAAVDISGWELLDSTATVVHTVPSGTTLDAGEFYVATGITGLDSADSLTLRRAGDLASVVAHTWHEDGIASYSRCELFGSVSYVETPTATWGAANACPSLTTEPWPGASTVTTVDDVNGFGDGDGNGEGDVSGATFDPADPSILWVVQNKNTLHRLHKVGGTYVAVDGWEGGKKLHFATGTGAVDSEGVTVAPDGSLYVTSERDNDFSDVSSNKILRYDVDDVTAATTQLTATHEWDVNDKVVTGTNLGLEGIAYVPDAFLAGAGWEVDGATYATTDHPTDGLFAVAVEGTGAVHFFSLAEGAPAVEVKVEASGFPFAMDVAYDADRSALWTLCDDSCGGVYNLLTVVDGDFAPEHSYARPTGMPNLNNEGMAIAPASTCVDGSQEVVWADDGDTDGHSLRSGTLPCPDVEPATPTVTGEDVTVKHGRAASMDVTVTADEQTPTGEVTLTSGATSLGSATLRADGTATVAIAKNRLRPRSNPYPVTVTYGGDGSVAAGTGTASLTVLKGDVRLSAVVRPGRVKVRRTRAVVTVKVVNPDRVLETGTVAVSAKGIKKVTARVVDGRATLRLGVFKRAGQKRLTIRYGGSTLLAPAVTTRILRVVR